MQKVKFEVEYISYANELELEESERSLLSLAKEALQTSYSPYSQFKVGAAILLANGAIVLGSNQENAAYPVTLCAERTAFFSAAVQYHNIPIIAAAITVETQKKNMQKAVSPCGSCRQVMLEYELKGAQDIKLILQGDAGEVLICKSVKDILPLYFDASYL